ncbi:MAG: PEP-CTERM sorting domain-containing protein [Phycisphaeraceae bacterium]
MTPVRKQLVGTAAIVFALFPALPSWAAYVTQTGPVVLSDDFEAPVGPGTGYTIGQSPVDIGPWGGTAGTTGNNNTQVVAGNGGQMAQLTGVYDKAAGMNYRDTAGGVKDYYYDFDYLPGIDTAVNRYGSGPTKNMVLSDSGGAKKVLEFGVTDDNDPANPNRYYVVVSNSTTRIYYGNTVVANQATKVQLFLDNTGSQQWAYTLYLDGQLLANAVVFDTTGSGAGKADTLAFLLNWQDSFTTSIDNFNWRTDGFARAIPEPTGLGLMGIGALCMGIRRGMIR